MMARAIYTLAIGLLTTMVAYASTADQWRFKVYLDEKEIGYHHFTLSHESDALQLSSEARFDVTFLKIPLFRYRHNSTELWSRNCLVRITSSTDSNGKHNRLEGGEDGNVFVLRTTDAVTELPDCIASFAYWNRDLLNRDRLLNPQTGDYLDAELEYLGVDSINVATEKTTAHRYRLTTGEQPIELWYSDNNQWLALKTTVAGNRSLRYVIE